MEKKTKETTKTTRKKQPETLLQAIEHIADMSRQSQLCATLMDKCSTDIKYLAKRFGITDIQAVLFSVCLDEGPYHISYGDIAQHLGVSGVRAQSYGNDLEELVARHYLRFRNAKDQDTFDVPDGVVKALRHNEVFTMPELVDLDCYSIFYLLNQWFDDLDNNTISPQQLQQEVIALFKNNQQVAFASKVLELNLCSEDTMVLVMFCHLLINDDDNRILVHQLDDLFEHRHSFHFFRRSLMDGSHQLMRIGLIEHACDDGIVNPSMFRLTDKAKNDLLAEMRTTGEVKINNLIHPDDITFKKLFFPKMMKPQIDEMMAFVDEKQFAQIKARLSEQGMRTGLACLFYGPPGTGKTETAYQLARLSGRDVMVVDVPQIKSKWVGDSEKNIKAMFERYRDLVKRCKLAPILLFNEADAIIGVRKSGAENAVDKMENTIQNIILQEMETLDGIMIATTNLVGNLDSAFERRFLYKVRFEKPDATVRTKIWKQMIPGLSADDAAALAAEFALSGGQIENVTRRNTINHILHGDQGDILSTLKGYCKEESLQGDTPRRMGFR